VDATISTGSAIKYKWSTVEGKIIGSDILPTAKLSGAGIYTLEITDNHGCKSIKTFKFPLEIDEIIANPDYARIAWTKDTTLNVLANDHSTVDLVPSSVRILEPATKGITKINVDGSITYIPRIRIAGRDQFVYEVCDAVNLCASATVTIDIFDNSITLAEGFSPNGDGINDELVFKGLETYPKSQLYIFTRSGQPIYQSNDYLNNWDGRTMQSTLTKKELVPTGVYYYVLKIGGTTRTIKGFVYIGY
jgi:gliding motility-associated-like protein